MGTISKSNRALAYNLRKLREAQDISQEKFALKCGLDRTYISGIERRVRNVTLATLDKIAETLGVAAADLLQSDQSLKRPKPPATKRR